MANYTFQLRRGLKANIPAVGAAGEPHYLTDTQELRFGNGASMVPLKMATANVIGLLSGGKISTSLLPDLSITDVSVVADITARDALTPDEGDVAVVLSNAQGKKESFIYDGTAWQTLGDGAGGISSVNGQTGPVVTLDTDDISEGTTNLWYTDTRVSTYIATQINQNNGIAGLSASGKLNVSVLPTTVVQAGDNVTRLGSGSEASNSIPVADGTGGVVWTTTLNGGTF